MAINGYTAAKTFSASKVHDRDQLGDRLSAWMAENRNIEVIDTMVLQSSDEKFHCLSFVVFYRQTGAAAGAA